MVRRRAAPRFVWVLLGFAGLTAVVSSLSSSSMLLVLLFRRRGIEARKKFVAPVGAWYSQVGRLHQVHHMWQYP